MSINYLLAIPYEKKDEMKTRYGIKWNQEHKMWCAKNERDYNGLVKYHVIKVNILFKHNETFKKLGGQWNGTYHYVHKGLYNKLKNEIDLCTLDEDENVVYSDEDS